MSVDVAVLYVVIGFAAGVLSTSFGIGGGALSTPSIRAMGITALFAIGTTLPSVLPGVITGMYGYRGRRLVRYDVVAIIAPTGIMAAIGGSFFSHRIPGNGHLLMLATAAILMMNAIQMARPRPRSREKDSMEVCGARLGDSASTRGEAVQTLSVTRSDQSDAPLIVVQDYLEEPDMRNFGSVAVLAGTGVLAGLISGLLGLGGGIALVPILAGRIGLSLRQATATSLVCVGVLAVPSILAHSIIGDINWPVAGLLTLGTIPGARLGASVALKMSEAWLRRSAAGVLSVISLVYAVSEILALLR